MKRYLFIINPVAGKGKSLKVIPMIKEMFDKDEIDYDIKITEGIGHGEALARLGAEEYTHIISVGGDGTVYEVLNGLRGKDITLGILPTGTGNDFARTINLPKGLENILSLIKNGKEEKIDIGVVDNKVFINLLSVGVDAEIAKEVENVKKYFSGTVAYIVAVFKILRRYKSKKVSIFIDGVQYNREIELIAIGNGKYYGGGMKITPEAEIKDGLLEICIVNRMNKLKLAALFPTVFLGKHIGIKDVEILKGKEVEICCDEPLIVNADGNIIGFTPIKVSIEELSQKIIIP